jgi:hypothetical protein
MTTYVALPLSEEYIERSDRVIEKLSSSKASSQARETAKTTKLLIDDMFEILVDDLVEQVKMKKFAKKIVHQVSVVVHKAIHAMVDKVISKLSNRDLKPIVSHFKNLEILHEEEQRLMGFQLNDELEEMVVACIEHLENDNVESAKQELVTLLENILDHSLELFLVEPMSLIKLGMISRKVVDFVTVTIEKTVPQAIGKIIEHMDKEELESLRDFLLTLLVSDRVDARPLHAVPA